MCRHLNRLGPGVQFSALVHTFSKIILTGRLRRAVQALNSHSTQILYVSNHLWVTFFKFDDEFFRQDEKDNKIEV
jgi:hypothetical protein